MTPSSTIRNFRNNPKKPGSPGFSIKIQAGPTGLHRNPCHNSCVLIRRVGRTRTVPCSCAVSDVDRLHRATRGTTPPFKLPDAYPGSIRKRPPRWRYTRQSVLRKMRKTSSGLALTGLSGSIFPIPTRAGSHHKKAARQEFRSVTVSAVEDQYCQGQCCQPPSDYVMPAHNTF